MFVQLVLGAVMRHTKRASRSPTFRSRSAGLVPPLDSFPVVIAFAHRAWALVVAVLVFAAAASAARSGLKRTGFFLGLLVVVQIALGAATVTSGKSVAITTAHVATGALLLGTAVALSLGLLAVPRRSLDGRSRAGLEPSELQVLAWK